MTQRIASNAKIHPQAIVESGAEIGENTTIGPFCIIGPDVKIGANCTLKSHVVIDGHVTLGDGNFIFQFASIGSAPQDLKFGGEVTQLIIGDNNTIREYATMNPGTASGGGVTRIGNNGLFMIGSHIAHDCQIGDGVILVNNATLAGHIEIGNNAIMGGMTGAHQFVRIGRNAMVGGMSGVEKDLIPYGMLIGNRGKLDGLNLIGLKRAGFEKKTINRMRAAYKELFMTGGVLADKARLVAIEYADCPPVIEITDFILSAGPRSVSIPAKT